MSQRKEVIVPGELNLDILAKVDTEPEFGREIYSKNRVSLGSSSAIFAVGMARLGGQVDFVGKVGDDFFGNFVIQQLINAGVGVTHIIVDPTLETGSTVGFTKARNRALMTDPGAMTEFGVDDINVQSLSRYKHLHISSIFLQPKLRPDLPYLFKSAQDMGLTTSLDTGWNPMEKWGEDLKLILKYVDYFLPNEDEAMAISGQKDISRACEFLARLAGTVIIKRGSKGALGQRRSYIVEEPAFLVEVVDTTGAGDSFNAGFIYSHVLQKMSFKDSLRFANICGALSTRGLGGTTTQPKRSEVDQIIDSITYS